MRNAYFLLYILILSFLSSCGEEKVVKEDRDHFDLVQFCDSLVATFPAGDSLWQVIQLDEQTDRKRIPLTEADSVLNLLRSYDLNAEKYFYVLSTDTFENTDGSTIRYSGDNSIDLQHCTITSDQDGISQIVLSARRKSLLYTTSVTCEYYRNLAFRVTTEQKTTFFPERTYRVGIDLSR